MDAPPNGPEEAPFLPGGSPSTTTALLVSALDLLRSPGGTVELDVAGTSMRPTFSPGDRVRVHLAQQRTRLGDVIVFTQGDSIVVHRYLGPATDRTGRPCLRSRGDGRHELDPPLRPENLLGSVRAVRRGGAWRSLDGAGARAYGAAIAAHDLFWAGAVHVARRLGLGGASRTAASLDRMLLRIADAALFRRLHPPAPEAAAGPYPTR